MAFTPTRTARLGYVQPPIIENGARVNSLTLPILEPLPLRLEAVEKIPMSDAPRIEDFRLIVSV
jgi:hypothetical protein